jgi:hypothetical protein
VTTTAVAPVLEAPVASTSRLPVGPYVVFVLLIGASIPWRSKTYYEGGVDSVVLAKAVLSLVALGLAVIVTFRRPVRPIRAAPLVFLLCYLACTMLGAWNTGYLIPGGVIATRVLLVAVTVIVLSRVFSPYTLLGSLVAAVGTFVAAGAVTGIGSLAEGRLAGGIPPLHPNELASGSAVVMLYCLWRVSAGQDTWVHLAAIVGAGGVLAATGSRTPLIAMAVASLIVVFNAQAIRMRTLVLGLALAPVALWMLAGTDVVRSLLFRDETVERLSSLSNRTIAWQAALAPKDSPWLTWFGGGLQLKRIQVPGQFWNVQILDSSWVSALVQAGMAGLVVCVVWVLYSALTTLRSPARLRALQLTLLVYLTLRGFLESGLFDASTSFILFFTTVMVTPVGSLAPPGPSATAEQALAPDLVRKL